MFPQCLGKTVHGIEFSHTAPPPQEGPKPKNKAMEATVLQRPLEGVGAASREKGQPGCRGQDVAPYFRPFSLEEAKTHRLGEGSSSQGGTSAASATRVTRKKADACLVLKPAPMWVRLPTTDADVSILCSLC